MWTVCEFHGSNGNGFGYIWWTDKLFYFSKLGIYSVLKTDPLCKPTSMSKYSVVSQRVSLSSEYHVCPVLWRHTAPVFLSFSTTTKSSSTICLIL